MKNSLSFSIRGNLVDVHQQRIYFAEIVIRNYQIFSIREVSPSPSEGNERGFILPGFIDSHVHIESSMLVPSEFARLAVVHGTVATVSDPHEIANVCGLEGVEFMIQNGKTVPFKFNFGAPSCVPATEFETSGAILDSKDVEKLLQRDEIKYLSEMMNFPGVLNQDEEVMKKITSALTLNKPVDGHAPGLKGESAKKYIAAGISTDHECFTKEEALNKLQNGMKILIREGSAAKNFEALIELLHKYPDQIMFCSDDKHPDSLVEEHINQLCERAIKKGIDLFKILKAACINPVLHYKLNVGLLKENDPADFIIVKDLENFKVEKTFINGLLVAENGKCAFNPHLLPEEESKIINNFSCAKKMTSDFKIQWAGEKEIPVIEALDGQLITNTIIAEPTIANNYIISNTEKDILKIAVVNRYKDAPVAKSFIKNFGLKKGAIASSVAHDSHNIIAVAVDDESLCRAVNMIIQHKGGLSFCSDDLEIIIPLPVAGLMSMQDGYKIAEQYKLIDKMAKENGAILKSPFMTLSFMALLVIPELKLSDKGLFDGNKFEFLKDTYQYV